MSVFNYNLRFICKKMGLSQQRLADLMDIKRGKVAGYFYETQAKPEFYEKLGEKFQLNVGKFLTVEMNDSNYDSFFLGSDVEEYAGEVAESPGRYQKKSQVLDLLIQVKDSNDASERSKLLDEIIKMYGKVLDENSKLKDANSDLKDQLLEMAKKLIRN